MTVVRNLTQPSPSFLLPTGMEIFTNFPDSRPGCNNTSCTRSAARMHVECIRDFPASPLRERAKVAPAHPALATFVRPCTAGEGRCSLIPTPSDRSRSRSCASCARDIDTSLCGILSLADLSASLHVTGGRRERAERAYARPRFTRRRGLSLTHPALGNRGLLAPLLVAQRFDRIERRCPSRGIYAEHDADNCRERERE